MCIYIYIYVHIYIYRYISSEKSLDTMTILVAMSSSSVPFVVSKDHFPLKGSRAPWKITDSMLGQEMYKVSMEYLVISETNETVKDCLGSCQKDPGSLKIP